MPVAAAVLGGDTLGREVGHDVELVFAHHLDDRNAFFSEGAPLCLLPRRLVAEGLRRRMLDLGGVDAVVLVRDVDGERAGPVGGLGDRDGEVAMAEADQLEQRVAAAERDAAADDQLRVAPELVRFHRCLGHSGRR